MMATIGHVKSHSVTTLLVYCPGGNGGTCWHQGEMSVDDFANDIDIPNIGPRMRCQKCGRRGADVRPDWPTRKGRRVQLADDDVKKPPAESVKRKVKPTAKHRRRLH